MKLSLLRINSMIGNYVIIQYKKDANLLTESSQICCDEIYQEEEVDM